MKKLYLLATILTAIFVLVGCDQAAMVTTSEQPLIESSTVSVEDFALQATSVNALLLSNLGSADLLSYTLLEGETTEEPVLGDEVSELDMYLELMAQFLDNDNGLTVTLEDSDRAEYAFKVTYTISTLYDGLKTYILYYNQTTPVIEEPAADDSATEEPTTEEDPLITTSFGGNHDPFCIPFTESNSEDVTAYIDGVLVDGDVETLLEGALIQTDTEEILRLYAYVDEGNFVRVSVQNDTEDQTRKFFYQVMEEGILVSESKIASFVEDGEIHIRLQMISGTTYTEFTATQETVDYITTIHVRYVVKLDGEVIESGNVHIVGTYDELTGETTFEYTVLPDGFAYSHKYEYKHQCGPYGSFNGEARMDEDHGNKFDNGNSNDHGKSGGKHPGGMWNPYNWFPNDDTTDEVPSTEPTEIPDTNGI